MTSYCKDSQTEITQYVTFGKVLLCVVISFLTIVEYEEYSFYIDPFRSHLHLPHIKKKHSFI